MSSVETISHWSENHAEFRPEHIADITPGDIPEDAAELFSVLSGHLTRERPLKIDQFDRLMSLSSSDGFTTYFAQHDKYYEHIDKTDRVIYLADIDEAGGIVGIGEVSAFDVSESDMEPVVFMTRTDGDLKGRGLGTRRLLAMNAVALKVFNKTLTSDVLLSDGAVGAWRHLVGIGLAYEFEHESTFFGSRLIAPRFRFNA